MNNKSSIEEFYSIHSVDQDFDENFYQKEYPETQNFYQPFCQKKNIDNRHRLFYHYMTYGNQGYKNLSDKNKNILVTNISSRKHINNKLAIITSFFNPCSYSNINKNYLQFASHIKNIADLFPIELSFDNHFVIEDSNAIHIDGNQNNILWQKEALLNIALSNLPPEYTDVAWIDCDIIFENTNWVAQLCDALNNYKIVQLFRTVYKIDANNIKKPYYSLLSTFPYMGESGFAWAARREILDEIKLLDNQIFGGADFIMVSAFLNQPHMIEGLARYINNDHTKQWINKTQKIVNQSVGYIDSIINHLYHGNIYNREYTRQIHRQQLISSIDFDKDVSKIEGIWTISDQYIDLSHKYFLARQEDDNIYIQKFLDTNFSSYEECLDFYKEYICENVMHTSPDMITKIRQKMTEGITHYAQNYSGIYATNPIDTIYSRQQLNKKEEWLCKNIQLDRIILHNTSGSTTGEPFSYHGDQKYFDFIQRVSEFDIILKEYHLYGKPLKILNLFKHPYNPKPTTFYLKTHNHSTSRFHTYGALDTTTYFVNWDSYIDNPDDWHLQLLDLLKTITFDIVLAGGPVINILCRYIKKHNFKHYFTYLLSHTTEFPRISDFHFLKENKNITHYCDHMRCYDGGANFFTCKYGTYHLNDHLSWTIEGPDHKMISTDYFNIVSPFINYWNGDLCTIDNNYQLCDCGRYYRPFKMLENRPFAIKGPTKLTEIKKQIGALEYKYKIDQVQFENLSANIYLNKSLTTDELETLQNILQDYKIKINIL